MTSDRPYRKALPINDAIEEIKRGAGTQFCPVVVDALVRALRRDARLADDVPETSAVPAAQPA
jgi:HD-GYP domain-containing protein (c-di-GMP phosphodiesterase class II)